MPLRSITERLIGRDVLFAFKLGMSLAGVIEFDGGGSLGGGV